MMASIKNELNMLDAKISEFQQLAGMTENEFEPIDLEPISFLEPAEEPHEDDDLPFFEEESVAEPVPVKEEVAPIIDTMTDKQAWRTDMPGSPVKDVRSAISLNDRILFINKLFDEDPMEFQEAIGKVNSFETFAQVVEYISTEHSDWNLESDTVYRFMMAVRRKVR